MRKKKSTRELSSRAKGQRNQKLVKQHLEKYGWLIQEQQNVKYAKVVDLFGKFDLIGIRNDVGPFGHLYVQVKTNRKPRPYLLREYAEFYDKHLPPTAIMAISVVFEKEKEIRSWTYLHGEWREGEPYKLKSLTPKKEKK